jgi:hypothetical protein
VYCFNQEHNLITATILSKECTQIKQQLIYEAKTFRSDNKNTTKSIEITKEILVKIERVLNRSISFSEEGEKVLGLWSFQMCIKMRNYLGSMKII